MSIGISLGRCRCGRSIGGRVWRGRFAGHRWRGRLVGIHIRRVGLRRCDCACGGQHHEGDKGSVKFHFKLFCCSTMHQQSTPMRPRLLADGMPSGTKHKSTDFIGFVPTLMDALSSIKTKCESAKSSKNGVRQGIYSKGTSSFLWPNPGLAKKILIWKSKANI